MDVNTATEVAYKNGFKAGKKAAADQILEVLGSKLRLSKVTHMGQTFYSCSLEQDIEALKKQFEVD